MKFHPKYFVYSLILLVNILLTVRCGEQTQNNKQVYSGIIEEDVFIHILEEIQLAEAQATVLRVDQPTYKDSIPNYYKAIFDKYSVSSEDFYFSLEEYSKDPKKLYDMYGVALENLRKKETELANTAIPTLLINAISRQQLGDIILQTPIAAMILKDEKFEVSFFKDTLVNYLKANPKIVEESSSNIESIEFTFIINSNTKQMFIQLKEYLISKED